MWGTFFHSRISINSLLLKPLEQKHPLFYLLTKMMFKEEMMNKYNSYEERNA